MTFEEFKGLALNPPFSEERSVYRIDVFRIVEQEDGVDYYPRYGVRKRESFILPTFDEAHGFILSGEISKYEESPVYCIHIYELPFGKDVIYTCCKREWVFDSKGALIEQSVCSSLTEDLDKREGHFWGRPKDSIKFKPGDIVEVHDIDNMEVRLAIIVSLCNDIESCWKEYQKVIDICKREGIGEEFAEDNYWLNASDDCYYVAYDSEQEYGTSWPYTTDVFSPRFTIPDELKTKLHESYHTAINKLSDNNNSKGTHEKSVN